MQRGQSAAVIQKEEVITRSLSPFTERECGISHIFLSPTGAAQSRQVAAAAGRESPRQEATLLPTEGPHSGQSEKPG